VAVDVGFMAEPVFGADFCGTLIVSKQNDFDIRVEQSPTLQGIALNDAAVAPKGFRRCEQCEHFLFARIHLVAECAICACCPVRGPPGMIRDNTFRNSSFSSLLQN
jgi:hypothetical protein